MMRFVNIISVFRNTRVACIQCTYIIKLYFRRAKKKKPMGGENPVGRRTRVLFTKRNRRRNDDTVLSG